MIKFRHIRERTSLTRKGVPAFTRRHPYVSLPFSLWRLPHRGTPKVTDRFPGRSTSRPGTRSSPRPSPRVAWCPAELRTGPDWLEQAAIRQIGGRLYRKRRAGYDEREILLVAHGTIAEVAGEWEFPWSVRPVDGCCALSIHGRNLVIFNLLRQNGAWRGHWLGHERMPVELSYRAGEGSTSAILMGLIDRPRAVAASTIRHTCRHEILDCL
jgi:hypothetical protein